MHGIDTSRREAPQPNDAPGDTLDNERRASSPTSLLVRPGTDYIGVEALADAARRAAERKELEEGEQS